MRLHNKRHWSFYVPYANARLMELSTWHFSHRVMELFHRDSVTAAKARFVKRPAVPLGSLMSIDTILIILLGRI
jgi:hypothetical protein